MYVQSERWSRYLGGRSMHFTCCPSPLGPSPATERLHNEVTCQKQTRVQYSRTSAQQTSLNNYDSKLNAHNLIVEPLILLKSCIRVEYFSSVLVVSNMPMDYSLTSALQRSLHTFENNDISTATTLYQHLSKENSW